MQFKEKQPTDQVTNNSPSESGGNQLLRVKKATEDGRITSQTVETRQGEAFLCRQEPA